MEKLSDDFRERILKAYIEAYNGMGTTQEELAKRFCVSRSMVSKLLTQWKKTGSVKSTRKNCGRKPYFTDEHRRQIEELLEKKPDATLQEIKDILCLECSISGLHGFLKRLGITFKKNSLRQRTMPERSCGEAKKLG